MNGGNVQSRVSLEGAASVAARFSEPNEPMQLSPSLPFQTEEKSNTLACFAAGSYYVHKSLELANHHNSNMTDRRLPEWMSKSDLTETDAQEQVQTGPYKTNLIDNDLPYLEFTGTVIFSQEKNDCCFLSEDLRSTLSPGSAVGFDIEWPPSFTNGPKKKVALVQLCVSEEKCYLFHLSVMSRFPTGLKIFLEDENIRKVGVGIQGDMWKLLSDFDVKLTNFVELGDLANERLRCGEKWSLDGLVKHLFKKRLSKQNDVRCSNWDDYVLSEEQKRYAATDAYAGLVIHNKLCAMDPAVLSQSDLKDKLSRMAREMVELSRSIPEEVNDIKRAGQLLEDLRVRFSALKDFLSENNVAKTECLSHDIPVSKIVSPDRTGIQGRGLSGDGNVLNDSDTDCVKAPRPAGDAGKPEDFRIPEHLENAGEPTNITIPEPKADARKPADYPQDFLLSLDISEFELEVLERQARLEDLEERCTQEFQETEEIAMNNSADLSYEVECDDELESEMLQCAEEIEKLSQEKRTEPEKTPPGREEEEEDIEEEQEEEFDPSLPEPLPEQIKCLKMYFGHSRFKPVQWKVINSVLKERRDHLVVMATGYGKSLCFQFPPVYCVGVSIVISPLIALMEDQVLQLTMSNIPACYLGSAQTKDVLSGLKLGQYRVVYMTPEYCSGNVNLLVQLNQSIGISLIAVDEAHCVSEWGHDFRGAYQSLGCLKRSLPDVSIVALTATASPSIREDIVRSLQLDSPIVTCTSFDRPNLYLDVSRKSGGIVQDLKGFLTKASGGDYAFEGSSIVYCPSRKEAERVTSTLTSLGVACGVYHAGLGIRQRRETQHRFMRDEIQCIVATVAFGMGINKPDIRKVVHYGAPKEMESYYQEIGRAGRDGLPSACHVLWAPADLQLNRFLINQVANNRFRGYKLKMMGKMDQYLNSSKCRRKLILSHFEDKQLRRVTSGIMGTDKCCDNCRSGAVNRVTVADMADGGRRDYGVLAFQLMGAIGAMGERFGSSAPVLFLRGSYSQKVPEKYRHHPLFGAGKSVSEACWKALVRHLVNEDYLMDATGSTKFCILCKITNKGRKWLSEALNEQHRTLMLQSVDADLNAWSALRQKQPSASVDTNTLSTLSSDPQRHGPHVSPTLVKALLKSVVPSARMQPIQKAVSQPQPVPISARELELQTLLYAKLVAERQKLAGEKDIPPAILATNRILLDLARIRPCTTSSLKQVDGVSEAKSGMLQPLLKLIAGFCVVNKLPVDSSAPAVVPGPEGSGVAGMDRPSGPPLPNSIAVTYRLFQEEGKSMTQVSGVRSLPVAVLESQLIQAFRADRPLDLERAGLTASLRATITSVIQSPLINSKLGDFKAIRAMVPEHISTFLIQLTVELLRREGVPLAPPGVPTSQQQPELTWIEPEYKLVRKAFVPKPLRREHIPPAPVQHDLNQSHAWIPDDVGKSGDMSMDEDYLFQDLPMPEEMGLNVRCSSAVPEVHKTDPWTSGVRLDPCQDQTLDKDTQELFSDSPPPIVGQPNKRKLPHWTEIPRASTSSACLKKNKKKKGIFS
ncbi:hypothetical protein DPEC_G00320950 [Dallia pectoralis]|uniref:Uncharacterized protein n=1 Tax=Dallia pectoralis TaxID=75939 RepID=A0ACC2F9W5_DALPE|nr:hypothetical protein DPEC_G00320950 [Dallia pectoralis]